MVNFNENEISLLKSFVENKPLYETVKKAIMSRTITRDVSFDDQTKHWIFSVDRALDDTTYAKTVKLLAQAQMEMVSAFEELESLIPQEEKKVVEDYK